MQIKTFRASTMKEAIAAVKAGLGSDAVVLSTRSVKSLPGLRKGGVEVTAALDPSFGEKRLSGQKTSAHRNGSDTSMWESNDEVISRIGNLSMRLDKIEQSRIEAQLRQRLDHMNMQLESLSQAVSSIANAKAGDKASYVFPDSDDALAPAQLEVPFDGLLEKLIESGLDREIAAEVIDESVAHMEWDDDFDKANAMECVARTLMGKVCVTDPFKKLGSQQMVCALVGPTGVGKTTTIAKLAAAQVFGRGKKAAFLTVDTFRIGAVDQLRTYANIMEAPLEVIGNPRELNEKIARHADKDAIFLDTAGVSQRDEELMKKLAGLLDARRKIDIHLIVSATTQYKDLIDIADTYDRMMPVSTLIAGKLDECNAIGGIYTLATKKCFPLSYYTIGQNVPDDIESATPERLVDKMLGITAN